MKRAPQPLTVHRQLLRWYAHHKRDLPWRHTRDPYAIAISEVMLQQTQVDRVIPKYQAWLEKFPTMRSLAKASLHDILLLWSGLGYNSRAVRLRQMARIVVGRYNGRLPSDRASLEALPGVGRYTAGAVMSFAFKKPVGIIDTNIRRVVSRLWFGVAGSKTEKRLEQKVHDVIHQQFPDEWNHALMDLGAMICTSRRPKCQHCPLQSLCRAYPAILSIAPQARKQNQPFDGSDRYWRGQIVKTMIRFGRLSEERLYRQLRQAGELSGSRFRCVLRDLRAAGVLAVRQDVVSVAR